MTKVFLVQVQYSNYIRLQNLYIPPQIQQWFESKYISHVIPKVFQNFYGPFFNMWWIGNQCCLFWEVGCLVSHNCVLLTIIQTSSIYSSRFLLSCPGFFISNGKQHSQEKKSILFLSFEFSVSVWGQVTRYFKRHHCATKARCFLLQWTMIKSLSKIHWSRQRKCCWLMQRKKRREQHAPNAIHCWWRRKAICGTSGTCFLYFMRKNSPILPFPVYW